MSDVPLPRLRAFAPLVALVAVVAPWARSIPLAGELRNDTRERMAQWMIANVPSGAKVFIDWKPYEPSFPGGEFSLTYLPRDRIIEALDVAKLRDSGHDYLLLSSLFYDRYFIQPTTAPLLRERLRGVFSRVPIAHQVQPRFGTYGFHNPAITLFSLRGDDFSALEQERDLKRRGELEKTGNERRAIFRWGFR